jgi:hypothetical protein
MGGMSCLQTMNHVVKGYTYTPNGGMSCLLTMNHVVKKGCLWMGCPVYKQ